MFKYKRILRALISCGAIAAASQVHAATALNATSCTDATVMSGLAAVESAISTKNATALGNFIDPAYLNKGDTKTSFMAKVNSLFSTSSTVSISYTDVVCNPGATAGLEDVYAFEHLSSTNATTNATSVQVNRQHMVLKSNGSGGWTNYGNQLDFDTGHGTFYYSAPGVAVPNLGYWISLMDPYNLIQSVTVTGPGIATPAPLTASPTNGGTGTAWQDFNPTTGVSVLPMASSMTALPVAYTVTVTEKPVAPATTGKVTTLPLNFTAWNTALPTALAPSGNYTGATPPVMSWTAPAGGATYSYGVDVFGPPAAGFITGSMIWSNWNLSSNSVTYAGPALTSGACYSFDVTATDVFNNQASTTSNFGFNSTGCGAALPVITAVYSGSYTGGDSGTWSAALDSTGLLTITGFSTTNSVGFGGSGTVTNGSFSIGTTSGTLTSGATFTGSINSTAGTVSGTWVNGALTGTFSGTVAPACGGAGQPACTTGGTGGTTTPPATPAISFSAGWNLVGNGMSTPITVSSAFGNAANITSVWKWVPSGTAAGITYPTWAFYTPTIADGGAAYAASKGYEFLSAIQGGEGFWVNAKAAFSSPLAGSPVPSSQFANQLVPPNGLPTGWSLISVGDNPTAASFNVNISATPPSTGVIPLNVTSLWAWDAATSSWYFYAPSLDANGTLASYLTSKNYLNFGTKPLDPTLGFWVNHP